jgi:hypothetical protein
MTHDPGRYPDSADGDVAWITSTGTETSRSRNREMIGQPAFPDTRVFTTECTENTEGQWRKANGFKK